MVITKLRLRVAAACLLVVVVALAAILLRGRQTEPTHTAPIPVAGPAASIQIPIQTGSIAEIDAHRGATPVLFHLAEDQAVDVIDFPDLHAQAQMLNRVAALIEKADMPRDRVVSAAELDAHIRGAGGDPDAYYYGHDYRAADLARFFRLAAQQGETLNPYETWLHDRLQADGWLKPGAVGALITIPASGADIDASSRTTIFRHELSHAVYFTDPAYVALTQHLWNDLLSADERAAIRAFLGNSGYDTKDEDLMANEGQAYLINTHDPRYFVPSMVGIGPAREATLRGDFIAAIPEAWLRDSALAVAPVEAAAAAVPGVSGQPSSEPARPPLRDPRAPAAPPSPDPVHQ